MAIPTEIDFAIVKIGDGESPEVFSIVCGMQDISVNESANTTDRWRRDCAKPNSPPVRTIRVNGQSLDISGSGLPNKDELARLSASLGKKLNYRVEGYIDDGTDAGELAVTWAGNFVMTTNNNNFAMEGDGGAEINLANNGPYTITVAA